MDTFMYLRNTIFLSFLHGGYFIHLEPSETHFFIGHQITFNCFHNAHPGKYITWNKNNSLAKIIWQPNKHYCHVQKESAAMNYSVTCGKEDFNYVTRLTIPGHHVTEKENASRWYCSLYNGISSNPVTVYLSSRVQVKLQPEKIKQLLMFPKQSKQLCCVTNSAYEKLKINWYRNYTVVQNNYITTNKRNGNIYSVYNIQWGNGIEVFYCSVFTGDTDILLFSEKIEIQFVEYPKRAVEIIGGTPFRMFYEGDRVDITCLQRGGNPLPKLQWLGTCSMGTVKTTVDNGTVKSTVTILITKEMDGTSCVCKSTHVSFGSGFQLTKVHLQIFYPPKIIEIQQKPIDPWIENGEGYLECIFILGNPNTTVTTWHESGNKMPVHNASVLMLKHLSGKDHNKQFICRVENQFTFDKKTIVEKSIKINVEYPPRIKIYYMEEDFGSHKFLCKAKGNPVPKNIFWTFKGTLLRKGSVMYVNNTLKSHLKQFECHAEVKSSVKKRSILKSSRKLGINFESFILLANGLKAVSVTDTTVTVIWNSSILTKVTYLVIYTNVRSSSKRLINTQKKELTLTNLLPSTTYNISIGIKGVEEWGVVTSTTVTTLSHTFPYMIAAIALFLVGVMLLTGSYLFFRKKFSKKGKRGKHKEKGSNKGKVLAFRNPDYNRFCSVVTSELFDIFILPQENFRFSRDNDAS